MKNFFRKLSIGLSLIASFIVLNFGVGSLAIAATASSNANAVCQGVSIAGGADCSTQGTTAASNGVNSVVSTIINIFSWVVGVTAVFMVIVGGLLYIISGGDPQKSAKARNTIIYALVGLIIVALAQVIVRFVLGQI